MSDQRWNFLGGMAIALALSPATFAGEGWLIITSHPPGATIYVDNTDRGITPQRPQDALRIKVTDGVREIQARKQVGGKEYAAQQSIKVSGNKEIPVQLHLREPQMELPAVTSVTTPHLHRDQGIGTANPIGELMVPGKNF